jgi:hypothetical protein
MPDDPVHGLKIEYRAATTGSADYTVLADENPDTPTLDERISGYQPSMSATPQEAPGFGSPGIATFDNGNKKWTVAFSVDRVHADEGAALIFISDHAAAIGDLGNIDLKITTFGNSTWLVNCTVTSFVPNPASDKSTFIRYAFTGGIYTKIDPSV